MATSGSYNFAETRDGLITRALRIVDGISQGETPTAVQLSEASQALNDIVKSFEAEGMQLWRRTTINFTPTASTGSYSIGIGQTINQMAPTKVYQCWYRNNSTNNDTPMMLITRQEYDIYNNKFTTGTPNLLYYDPPGPNIVESAGTIYLLVQPDSNFASNNKVYMTVQYPLQDFDTGTDNPDFPSYYFEALVWALASDLCAEYGVPLEERDRIDRKAQAERLRSMAFDVEEGSLFIQPFPWYGN